MTLNELFKQHDILTGELAVCLRELGDTRAAITTRQGNAWTSLAHLNVTERREEVRHSCAQLVSDTEKQLGEIEALRAEIANITLRIAHHAESSNHGDA